MTSQHPQLTGGISALDDTAVTATPAPAAIELLEQRIAERTAGRIRDLRCETVGNMVVLSGRASTYYLKQLATQVALGEHGELAASQYTLQNAIDVV